MDEQIPYGFVQLKYLQIRFEVSWKYFIFVAGGFVDIPMSCHRINCWRIHWCKWTMGWSIRIIRMFR
jgi:hypothetical protein